MVTWQTPWNIQIALPEKLMFAGKGDAPTVLNEYKEKAAMRRVTAFSALYLLEDYRPLIKPLPLKCLL